MSIFRKVSLERLSSPEELDQLMRVSSLHAWLALGGMLLLLLMLLSIAAWLAVDESRTSAMQAKFFAGMARKVSYRVEKGPGRKDPLAS